MNPEINPELTVQALMALRKESDAVRVITERLKVKEMGPSDHIRTKHEVRIWIEMGGGNKEAERILLHARQRHLLQQSQQLSQTMHKSQSHEIG